MRRCTMLRTSVSRIGTLHLRPSAWPRSSLATQANDLVENRIVFETARAVMPPSRRDLSARSERIHLSAKGFQRLGQFLDSQGTFDGAERLKGASECCCHDPILPQLPLPVVRIHFPSNTRSTNPVSTVPSLNC
jgi:hypothetical protein